MNKKIYQEPEPRASRKQFNGNPNLALDLDRLTDRRMGAQTQLDYSNPYALPQTDRLRPTNQGGKKRLHHPGQDILSKDPQRRNREERNRQNNLKKYY